jgi:hypothetical protein
MEKAKIPDRIEKQMKMWRQGFVSIPKDYIEFHRDMAEVAVAHLADQGYFIHCTSMVSDGWMDGMKILQAIVEHKRTGEVLKLQWHDGNQEFFVRRPIGYGVPLRLYKKA